mgnify:CR=1 FL=1
MNRCAALLSLALIACQPAAERARSAPLEAPLELVALGLEAPDGPDALPTHAVAFRSPDGALRPVDRRAARFVPRWRDGAALVDPEGRLYQVWPDGQRRMLAAGVTALAVSDDLSRLAFAVRTDGSLRVHDGEVARTLAEGFVSIGALRFDPTGARVAFVGARNGGVAGVWVAGPDGAACQTNCDLRTGERWGDRFTPPPADLRGVFATEEAR